MAARKPVRLSAAELAQVDIEVEQLKQPKMLYPQRPPCCHPSQTAARSGTEHWHRFTGFQCAHRSVTSRCYGPDPEAHTLYYCAIHAPRLVTEATPAERQARVNEITAALDARVARITATQRERAVLIRQCHLYHSPELGEVKAP